jgi:cytidyltransferase-like protein
MKLAFFAGSFDPIHHGHVKIIEFVLEQYVDHVIICVHSHNSKKTPIPIQERLKIMRRVLSKSPFHNRIWLCKTALLHGIENTHFIKIAKQLMELNIKVFVLKGQDSLLDRSNYLLGDFPHLIHNRGGIEMPLPNSLRGPVIRFENLSDMSSTNVRKEIAAGKKIYLCDDTHD